MYTDYPFESLGDTEGEESPIRDIKILGYDGDKYCKIEVSGIHEWIKTGYIYKEERRFNPNINDNIDFDEFKI